MSKSTSSENSSSIFTLANFPIRMVIYFSVIGAMILPSYVNNQGIFYDINKVFEDADNHKGSGPIPRIDELNRKQQDYYLKHQRFSDSIKELELLIDLERLINPKTSDYRYRIVQPMMPVQDLNQSAIYNQQEAMILAIAETQQLSLKNYLGVVYTLPQTSAYEETQVVPFPNAILCEMSKENRLPKTMPKLINGSMQCPNGAQNWSE